MAATYLSGRYGGIYDNNSPTPRLIGKITDFSLDTEVAVSEVPAYMTGHGESDDYNSYETYTSNTEAAALAADPTAWDKAWLEIIPSRSSWSGSGSGMFFLDTETVQANMLTQQDIFLQNMYNDSGAQYFITPKTLRLYNRYILDGSTYNESKSDYFEGLAMLTKTSFSMEVLGMAKISFDFRGIGELKRKKATAL